MSISTLNIIIALNNTPSRQGVSLHTKNIVKVKHKEAFFMSLAFDEQIIHMRMTTNIYLKIEFVDK